MNKPLGIFTLLALSAVSLWASIDGTVINRTSGQPQAGVNITLLKPGQQGMQVLGTTVSDASGSFKFEKDQPGGGPELLQAAYKGVNYNKLLTPNIPSSNVQLEIYEVTKSPAVSRVDQEMMLIEPSTSRIAVNETVILQNDTNRAYNNDALGALRFYLPPAANGQVRVTAQGPQGMPLPRPAEKTDQSDIFKVDFPVKPGQTEFEVNYVLPAGSPFSLQGRVVNVKGMPTSPLRLVAPPGVTLSGKDIERIGTEPKTQATIYNVVARDNFSVDITGIGSLRPPVDAADETDDSDAPQVTEARPQIYSHLGWLVLLAFSILGVGLIILFRNSPVRSPYGK